MKKSKSNFGFTLIELMITIAIIGILTAVIFVAVNDARDKAKEAKMKIEMHSIADALQVVANDNNGNYPFPSGKNTWEILSSGSYISGLLGSNLPVPSNGGYYKYCAGGQSFRIISPITGLGNILVYSENGFVDYREIDENRCSTAVVLNGGNSYISAGNSGNILGKGGFTVSAWVRRKLPQSSENEVIFSQARGGYADVVISIDNKNSDPNLRDTINFSVTGTSRENLDGPGIPSINLRSNRKITDSSWHHIVAIRKEDGLNAALWIDGNLDSQISDRDPSTYTCQAWNGTIFTGENCSVYLKKIVPFLRYNNNCSPPSTERNIYQEIGRMSFVDCWGSPSPLQYFKGSIDEVRVYGSALSADNIGKIYQGNTDAYLDNSGTGANLLDYWAMNEGSGLTLNDASGNNNNASIVGATWGL